MVHLSLGPSGSHALPACRRGNASFVGIDSTELATSGGMDSALRAGTPPRYRWHLGCILQRGPTTSLPRAGIWAAFFQECHRYRCDTGALDGSAQSEFIREELRKAQAEPSSLWTVAFLHFPPFVSADYQVRRPALPKARASECPAECSAPPRALLRGRRGTRRSTRRPRPAGLNVSAHPSRSSSGRLHAGALSYLRRVSRTLA